MLIVTAGVACSSAAAPLTPVSSSPAPPPKPSAQGILDKTAHVYATARTYVERGQVTSVFILDRGGERTVEKPFEIAFVRNGAFRYEFRNRGDVYVVWSDPTRTLSQWTVRPGVETETSLGLALAGATGVSGGSAYLTPHLVMPGLARGRSAIFLDNAKVVGTELVGRHPCWRIEGTRRTRSQTLWIDEASFLLRKVSTHQRLPGAVVDQTTTFDPVIDQPVASELLQPPT